MSRTIIIKKKILIKKKKIKKKKKRVEQYEREGKSNWKNGKKLIKDLNAHICRFKWVEQSL